MTSLAACILVRSGHDTEWERVGRAAGWADEVLAISATAPPQGTDLGGAAVVRTEPPVRLEDALQMAKDRARATWMLVLDGDEEVPEDSLATMRNALEDDVDGYWVPTIQGRAWIHRHLDPTRDHTASHQLRLVRLASVQSWSGRVMPSPWFFHEPAPVLTVLDAPLIASERHDGAPWDPMLYRVAALRELDGETRLEAIIRLGLDYAATGDIVRAERVMDHAWTLARAQSERAPWVLIGTMRAQRQLAHQQVASAEETISILRERAGPHPNLWWLGAQCAIERAVAGQTSWTQELDAAREQLTRCLQMRRNPLPPMSLPGVCTWLAQTSMGTVCLLLEDPTRALLLFERALAARPGWLPARLGRIEACIELDRAPQAMADIADCMDTPYADSFAIAAHACDRLGASEHIARLVEAARRRAAHAGFLSSHRASLLESLRHVVQAAEHDAGAQPGAPKPQSRGNARRQVEQSNRAADGPAPHDRIDPTYRALMPSWLPPEPGTHRISDDQHRPPPVLLVVAPSAETTSYLADVLSEHPYIEPTRQPGWELAITQLARTMAPDGMPWQIGMSRIADAMRAFLDTLLGLDQGRTSSALLHSSDPLVIRILAEVYPEGRAIHLISDMQHAIGAHDGSDEALLQDADRYAEWVLSTRKALHSWADRAIQIRLEHLRDDPNGQRTTMFRFADLGQDAPSSEPSEPPPLHRTAELPPDVVQRIRLRHAAILDVLADPNARKTDFPAG